MTKRVKMGRERGPHYIAAWREHRKLTQAQLAELLNTTGATISRIEARKNGYTQAFLEACAEVLQCSPADLLRGPPDEQDEIIRAVNKLSRSQRLQAMKLLEILSQEDSDGPFLADDRKSKPEMPRLIG